MAKVTLDWYDQEFPAIYQEDYPEDEDNFDDVYDIPDELWEKWQEVSEQLRMVLMLIEKEVGDQQTKLDTPSWGFHDVALWGSIADHTELKFEKE